VSLPVEVASS